MNGTNVGVSSIIIDKWFLGNQVCHSHLGRPSASPVLIDANIVR